MSSPRTSRPRAAATPALVASIRNAATVSPAGTEAARALCPAGNAFTGAVGPTGLPAGAAALMQGSDSYDLLNRTDLVLRTLRRDNPTASGADLTDALIGAYCPAVANDPGLSASDKQQRLSLFRSNVLAGIAALPPVAVPR